MTPPEGLIVAAPWSGAGKSTVACGLARSGTRSGRDVQPFKVGPDFIDAGLLGEAADAPAFSLDVWLRGQDGVQTAVQRHTNDADLVLVEGMMGLFDGIEAGPEGSTAHVARLIDLPVVVVIDVHAMSASAGAIARGIVEHDPQLDVAGFVLNRTGNQRHARWVERAIERATDRPVFGALAPRPGLERTERHLGLHTTAEAGAGEWIEGAADAVEADLDLDRLLGAARPLPVDRSSATRPDPRSEPGGSPGSQVRVALARDAAFSFVYPENVQRLRAAGAEIVPWSPLADEDPGPVDGFVIGGGYPELHGQTLAGNATARKVVQDAADDGVPIHAECGGMLYLLERLEDDEGRMHRMTGLLDAEGHFSDDLTIGYVEGTVTRETPWARAGDRFHGHEFHRTVVDPPSDARFAYELTRGQGIDEGQDGWLEGNVLATYVHHHLSRAQGWAERFVARCRAAREGRKLGG